MGLEAAEQLGSLPLFAQALAALRMVHRAMLAKYPTGDSERELIESVITAAHDCVRDGQGTGRLKSLFERAMALRDTYDTHRRERISVRTGLWSAIDSLNAAEAASDFPIDATVTGSARKAIAALGQDREFNRLQITILLASDVDQLLFACGEVNMLPAKNAGAMYAGLGDHVFGRLAPVHALTLVHDEPRGEEAFR